MEDKDVKKTVKEVLSKEPEKVDASEKLSDEEIIPLIRGRYESMSKQHGFSEGMIVRWKKGLMNRKRPRDNEPAIVCKVLGAPIFDNADNTASTPYFQEPLDISIGLLGPDLEFFVFYVDSRRFEPYPDEKKKLTS